LRTVGAKGGGRWPPRAAAANHPYLCSRGRLAAAQGAIRWLRPEHQAPDYRAPVTEELDIGEAEHIPSDNVIPWPGTLPEQVSAIQSILASSPTPLAPQEGRVPSRANASPPCDLSWRHSQESAWRGDFRTGGTRHSKTRSFTNRLHAAGFRRLHRRSDLAPTVPPIDSGRGMSDRLTTVVRVLAKPAAICLSVRGCWMPSSVTLSPRAF